MNNSYTYQKINFHTFTKIFKRFDKEGFRVHSLTLKKIYSLTKKGFRHIHTLFN